MKQLNFFLIASLLSISATIVHAADNTTTTTTSTATAKQSVNMNAIMADLAASKNNKSTTAEEQETAMADSIEQQSAAAKNQAEKTTQEGKYMMTGAAASVANTTVGAAEVGKASRDAYVAEEEQLTKANNSMTAHHPAKR